MSEAPVPRVVLRDRIFREFIEIEEKINTSDERCGQINNKTQK